MSIDWSRGKRRKSKKATVNINRFLNEPDFQAAMLAQLGVQPRQTRPKVNILERALAMPMAIGSIPDAIYAMTEGKNPLREYVSNIGEGAKQTLTGRHYLDTKTTQDLLRKYDVLQGRDPLSTAGRFATGLLGDVVLDPITWLTFGAGGLGEAGAKTAVEETVNTLGKQGIKGVSKSVLDDVTKLLAKDATREATQTLAKESPQAARVLSEVLRKTARPRTVSAFGKQLASGRGVDIAEAIVNPLSPALRGGAKLTEQMFPELADTGRKLFNERAWAERKGLGGLRSFAKDFSDQLDTVPRKVAVETDAAVNVLKGLDDDIQPYLAQYIEGDVNNIPSQVVDKIYSIIDNNPEVKSAIDLLQSKSRAIGEQLQQRNLLGDLINNYVKHDAIGAKPEWIKETLGSAVLNDPIVQKSIKLNGGYADFDAIRKVMDSVPFKRKRGLVKAEQLLDGANLKRTFSSIAEGEKAGIVYNKDVGKLLQDTITSGRQAVIAHDFGQKLKTLTDDAGNKLFVHSDELVGSPRNWTKISGVKGLEDYYVPKEAADILKNHINAFEMSGEAAKPVLRAYDWVLTNFFKKPVTVMSPNVLAFNIRNATGDLTNMISGGFALRNGRFSLPAMVRAFKEARAVQKFESYAQKHGLDKAIEKYGKGAYETFNDVLDHGIVGGLQTLDEAGITTLGKASGKGAYTRFLRSRGMNKAANITDKLGQGWRKVEAGILKPQTDREELFRIANYIDHLQQTGGNKALAAARAKAGSLDYSNLTSFEKNFMKRVIPFYNFFRQNLELHLNNAINRPGRVMNELKFFRNLGQALSSRGATEEDFAALPEWMREGLNIITNKKGDDVTVLTGLGDPVSAIANMIGMTVPDTIEKFLSASAPMVKMPLEMALDKNMFTGQPISESISGTRYEDYPDWVKSLLDLHTFKATSSDGREYTFSTADPTVKYLLENLPIVSPWNTMGKRILEISQDPAMLANILSGARLYRRNLDFERQQRKREKAKRLGQQLRRKGVTKEYSGVYLNKEALNEYPDLAELLTSLGYTPPTKKKVKAQENVDISTILREAGY